jgi:hypothetical protein
VLSVEGFHDKSTCPADIAFAVREPGIDGAVVSEGAEGGALSPPPPPPQEIVRNEMDKRIMKSMLLRISAFIFIPSLNP